jgi:hypothetical protein
MVAGLPPIGCLPIQVTFDTILPTQNWLQRVCNVQQNIDSQNYNAKLQSNVHLLQATLQDVKVAYFDIYTPILDMVLYPAKYGNYQLTQFFKYVLLENFELSTKIRYKKIEF